MEPRILLVEDNLGDARLVEEALKAAGIRCRMQLARGAREALDALNGREPEEKACLPSLILLDLGLPGMSGRELLEHLKSETSLRSIPVVVLTASRDKADIERCYRQLASGYIVKPSSLEEFTASVRSLGRFWREHVLLPS